MIWRTFSYPQEKKNQSKTQDPFCSLPHRTSWPWVFFLLAVVFPPPTPLHPFRATEDTSPTVGNLKWRTRVCLEERKPELQGELPTKKTKMGTTRSRRRNIGNGQLKTIHCRTGEGVKGPLTDRAQKRLNMRSNTQALFPPFDFQNGGRRIKI